MSLPHQSMQAFVDNFNETYADRHEAFENQFWGTKMALKSTEHVSYSAENLAKTKAEMESLLADPDLLAEAKRHLASLTNRTSDDDLTSLLKTLNIIMKTCKCHGMPSKEAQAVREKTNQIESKLEEARNAMKLGYTLISPETEETDGEIFNPMSSVGLRNLMRTSSNENIRKAAYEGLRTIGPFVCCNGFVEIVKMRNKLANMAGKEDYYDYTVRCPMPDR